MSLDTKSALKAAERIVEAHAAMCGTCKIRTYWSPAARCRYSFKVGVSGFQAPHGPISPMLRVSESSELWDVDGFCYGACSVAVSYKPPMLVTRVRLPACAFSLRCDTLCCPITCEYSNVLALFGPRLTLGFRGESHKHN